MTDATVGPARWDNRLVAATAHLDNHLLDSMAVGVAILAHWGIHLMDERSARADWDNHFVDAMLAVAVTAHWDNYLMAVMVHWDIHFVDAMSAMAHSGTRLVDAMAAMVATAHWDNHSMDAVAVMATTDRWDNHLKDAMARKTMQTAEDCSDNHWAELIQKAML